MVYIMGLLNVSVWPEGLVALHKVKSFMRGLMTASNFGVSPSPPQEAKIMSIDWDVINQSLPTLR